MRLEARRASQSAKEQSSNGAGAREEVQEVEKSHWGLVTDWMRGLREGVVVNMTCKLLAWISG